MEAWLNEVNEALLCLGLFIALAGAAELGFRLGSPARGKEGASPSHASSIQGAVLGLLALLLGFSFSLAMARFEGRKELLRDEANTIGTTYLRAQLLPEPMRSRIPVLLRSYVQTRIDLLEYGFDAERRHALHARSSAIHAQVWQLAVAAAEREPSSEMVALFVSSLNDTIDMHGKRMAAIRNRIPAPIFVLLFAVALVSLGFTGYASGSSHRQSAVLNTLVALLIALVTSLIFDLHRPSRGLITVDPIALRELREGMR